MVCGGIINIRMTKKNSILFPQNLNFAKPYPTKAEIKVCKNATIVERINVLISACQYCIFCTVRETFSSVKCLGKNLTVGSIKSS